MLRFAKLSDNIMIIMIKKVKHGGNYMKRYSIPRHIWRAVYPILIFLGLATVISLVAGVANEVSIALDPVNAGQPLDEAMIAQRAETFIVENALLFQLISNAICILIFALMWRKIRTSLPAYEGNNLSVKVIALTTFLFVGINLLMQAVFTLIDVMKYFPSYEGVVDALSGGNFIIRFLTIGITAPLVEEILCRGILFNRLNTWMPTKAAVIVSSALFGIMHLNPLQSMYGFLVGVAFCVIYVRFRNLWIPIIAHVAFNMASTLLMELANTSEALEAAAAEAVEMADVTPVLAVGLIITIVCAFFIKRTKAATLAPLPEITEEIEA